MQLQHTVFSCSAQFHCIPFIPDDPQGVMSVYPGSSWNTVKKSHLKRENAADVIFLLPPRGPTLFPKFRLAVFSIQKTALNFLMA